MTELSTETYILYNKTINRGRNVLVQNVRAKRLGPKRPGAKRPGSKCPAAKRPGCGTSRSKESGIETSWSKISGGKTSRSKISRGETLWTKNVRGRNDLVRNVRERNVQVQNVRGRNVLGAKRRGLKSPGAKIPGPKCQKAKIPGPKCQRANVLVQNVRGRKVLSKMSRGETSWSETSVRKVRVQKHFLSLQFMIFKLSLWLWQSLRLLYYCEVLLLLSFKFDLWLVNWFLLNSGRYDTVDQNLSFGNDILTAINFNYKLPSPWPWPSGHGLGWGWYWKNLWTHTYHQTIHVYESDPSKGLEIMSCSNKCPKALRTTLHVGGETAIILVYRITYIAIWAILWQLALVSSCKRIYILHDPFLLSHHAAFQ